MRAAMKGAGERHEGQREDSRGNAGDPRVASSKRTIPPGSNGVPGGLRVKSARTCAMHSHSLYPKGG